MRSTSVDLRSSFETKRNVTNFQVPKLRGTDPLYLIAGQIARLEMQLDADIIRATNMRFVIGDLVITVLMSATCLRCL